jgi:hypothetical protein
MLYELAASYNNMNDHLQVRVSTSLDDHRSSCGSGLPR